MCLREGRERCVKETDRACALYQAHTREFFARVVNADRRLAAMAEQCERYREMAMQATGSTQALRVGGTRHRSKVEDGVVNLLDILGEIEEQAQRLRTWREEASAVIEALDDPLAKEVLELRYFSDLPWGEIAKRMRYEIAQIHRIHRRALTLAQREIEAREKIAQKEQDDTQ